MVAFWFRRDLRLRDNHALFRALSENKEVLPVFIFDKEILKNLSASDRRVDYIHRRLSELDNYLRSKNFSGILTLHDSTIEAWDTILSQYNIDKIYTNRDYEPAAIRRDRLIEDSLSIRGVKWLSFKDQVIFEGHEVTKTNNSPYSVFTPYKKQWLNKFEFTMTDGYDSESYLSNFSKTKLSNMISLEKMGFEKTDLIEPPQEIVEENIRTYEETRDYPALDTTSHLSVALRFGTRSCRSLVRRAFHLNETWLSELIWREFFMMILYHFPKSINHPFKEKYNLIQWRNDPKEFQAWCQGETGYELVDAGMRELNETGFMHNRVRMICASFLIKHLLIDWRWGERYFAQKLLDYDLSANVGNWQWAAGTGCDAAPYFRIFNPLTQAQKFDKKRQYIKQWVSEVDTPNYVQAIVEHSFARQRALKTYKKGLDAYE